MSLPRPGLNSQPVDLIRFGMVDANSGLDLATLSVRADFPVAGRPPGAELADLASEVDDGIWEIALGPPLGAIPQTEVRVEVRDVQGNVTRVRRRFATIEVPPPVDSIFSDGFESGDLSAWSG